MKDNPDIVFFDWDNTLSDTFPAIADSYNAVFRQYGMPQWSNEQIKANVRMSGRDAFPALFGEKWEEALLYYRTYYRDTHPTAPMFEGVRDVVAKLRARGSRTAVISNKIAPLIHLSAGLENVTDLFDVIVGAGDAPADKPDPRMMEHALKLLGITPDPQSIWYVGDSDIDLHFARNCGCKAVFVENAGFEDLDDVVAKFAPHGAFKNMIAFSHALD